MSNTLQSVILATALAAGQYYPPQYSLLGAIDVNGDNVEDIILGLNGYKVIPDHTSVRGCGRIIAVSGKDGSRLFERIGEKEGDLFGYCIAKSRDHDLDGISDLWVGAPGMRRQVNPDTGGIVRAGGVVLISGRTGTVLTRHQWTMPVDDGGGAIILLDDMDRDGYEELCIESESGKRLFAVSGKTGAVLWDRETDPWISGSMVTRIPDMNEDGAQDLALIATRGSREVGKSGGELTILSGATGMDIKVISGIRCLPEGWRFAGSLQSVVARGEQQVIVRCEDTVRDVSGVFIVSLASAQARAVSFAPQSPSPPIGRDMAASLGSSIAVIRSTQEQPDNRFAVSAPRWSCPVRIGSPPCGRVFVINGHDLSLQTSFGPTERTGMCACFGDQMVEAGDVNGDGISDLAIVTWECEDCPEFTPRLLQVFSGKQQEVLWRVVIAPVADQPK